MRRSRMVRALTLSVVLVLVLGGIADAQVELEPVATGWGEQYRAFANDSFVVYTHWNPRNGVSDVVAVSITDGSKTRLNASGKNGTAGGIDPGTNSVLYQQWSNRRSGLFLYDLDTGERTKAAGVNSRFWEWNPLISSTFVVYALDRYRNGALYTSLKVFERATNVTRTLGTWKWRPRRVFPGSAGDRYVSYTFCRRANTCFAYLYDWETATKQQLPVTEGEALYAPVVDEVNSAVYYSRSDGPCGENVSILRRPIPLLDADEPTTIVDLPDGIDTGWESSLAANASTGQTDLYIERWDCSRRTGDVYVARGVDA